MVDPKRSEQRIRQPMQMKDLQEVAQRQAQMEG